MRIVVTASPRMAHYLNLLRLSGLYGDTVEEVATRLVAERLQQLVMERRHLILLGDPAPGGAP